jgi:hypothetical protein
MWQSTIAEVALGPASFVFGLNFMGSIKYWHYRTKIIANPGLMMLFVRHTWPQAISVEGVTASRESKDHSQNLRHLLRLNQSATLRRGSVFLLASLGTLATTFLLCPSFTAINIVLSCAGALLPITDSMNTSLLAEIHQIVLLVYRWNASDPCGCSEQLPNRIPGLVNVLEAVQQDCFPVGASMPQQLQCSISPCNRDRQIRGLIEVRQQWIKPT